MKIYLCDDHPTILSGLQVVINNLPNRDVVASYTDGSSLLSALEAAAELPDVVMIDVEMPGLNGIDCTRKIKKKWRDLKVVIFSMFDSEVVIADALRSMADGYVLKSSDSDELAYCLELIEKNGFFLPKEFQHLSTKISYQKRAKEEYKQHPVLTDNELEVLKLICEEKSSSEIAEVLYKSKRTIDGYRNKLIDKLEVNNTAGLVKYALVHGLYRPEFS